MALVVAVLGFFVVTLDAVVVNVALPSTSALPEAGKLTMTTPIIR